MLFTTTPAGHGRQLPPWANPNHPEARRGTLLIREADPNLIVTHCPELPGLVPRTECFVLFGPSKDARGWVPISPLRDSSGNPFRAPLPWPQIVYAIRRQYALAEQGKTVADEVAEHNAAVDRERERLREAAWQEAVKYGHHQLQRELSGEATRFSARDVMDGYHAANESRKPEKKGLVVSVPRALRTADQIVKERL